MLEPDRGLVQGGSVQKKNTTPHGMYPPLLIDRYRGLRREVRLAAARPFRILAGTQSVHIYPNRFQGPSSIMEKKGEPIVPLNAPQLILLCSGTMRRYALYQVLWSDSQRYGKYLFFFPSLGVLDRLILGTECVHVSCCNV